MHSTPRRARRLRAGTRTVLASVAAACVFPALAAEPEPAKLPPDRPLIGELVSHARPQPYPIPLPFAAGEAPIYIPYVDPRVRLDGGVAASVFEANRPVKLGAGYGGAGDAWEAIAQGTMEFTGGMGNAAIARRTIDDYDDGSGASVRFGYDRTTGQVGGAWFPAPGRTVRAAYVYDRIDDLKMPLAVPVVQDGIALVSGAGADPVKTERNAVRLSYEDTNSIGALRFLRIAANYVDLERAANNFALRTTPQANWVRNALSASIFDATVFGDFAVADALVRVGADVRQDDRDGRRQGGPAVNNLDQTTGFQAPGPQATTWGVFADAAVRPWADATLLGSLRGQWWDAKITRLDDTFTLPGFTGTPRSLYTLYYGPGLDFSPSRFAPSALVELRQSLAGGRRTAHATVSRIARFPDLFEWSVALPSSPPTNTPAGTVSRQVGNPGLATEYHNRIEAGTTWTGEDWVEWRRVRGGTSDLFTTAAWRFSFSAYVDWIDDFMTRDRAHGQPGVLRADNAAIWRSVDARFAGAQADMQWNATRNLSLRANVWWTYGQNTSDGRPVYAISPLEANFIADWHDYLASAGTWDVAARLRLVARQNRSDDNPATGSGYDPQPTAGFGVLDLVGGLQLHDRVGVQAGIDNVFDHQYAQHNFLRTTDDTNLGFIYAPGRFAWIRLVVNF